MTHSFHPCLSATIPIEQRDLFLEVCWELESVGLQEEETPHGIQFSAFFEVGSGQADLATRFDSLCKQVGLTPTGISWTSQEDRADEWLQAYRQSFTGFDIGDTFHIHPGWEPPSARHPINILIEPGHAFGTGTHESTRLCLLALKDDAPFQGRLLDVGTGSGILSIAAAKLSPQTQIHAMDNDPLAVEMARTNLESNHLQIDGLFAGELSGVKGRFEWIVANLTMEIFRRVAPEIMRLASGSILLSGFTEEQTTVVAGFFQAGRFDVVSSRTLNGWECIRLQRPKAG